ncbi:Na+/melibiose symporter-like transporter [Streptomyces sp. Ag109_O5-1]|uniref:MFS transporter n=1 Tax=Streptomyces sp. Ag109_O5-1 TaxID=1938851 RepID=UPI000F4F882A|nr:MFS transporter [Streptomyces sp. Ag109_O5-1]RPE39164.1 Na+/melibiose symporter-like transporter [Streptomyces sp. Ag109_O5-1]
MTPDETAGATTPFGRVMTSMVSSYVGAFIALNVPVALLLTLHLTAMVGKADVAGAIGVVTGAGAVAALVVNPLAGRVSDRTRLRFGQRRTWILTGGLAGAIAVTLMAFTTEVWQVVVGWCLVQALFNVQLATTGALMADQVPPARRGAISGALGFTVAIGPLIGLVAVVPFAGWTQWLVLGVLAAVGAVLAVIFLRDPLRPVPPQPLGFRALLTSYWVSPRRHPAFAWGWLVRFLVTAAGAAGSYNGVYLLQRMNVPESSLSGPVLTLSTIYVVIGGFASLAGGVLSDRLRRQKPFVLLAGVLIAAGLVMLAFAPSMDFVYVSTAISGVGAGIFLSVDVALSSRLLPNAVDIGKDFAVINLANTIPQSVVPLIAPLLLGLGGFTALYLTLAVIGLIGGILVLRLPELGCEGDPRFALLTTERPNQATAKESVA